MSKGLVTSFPPVKSIILSSEDSDRNMRLGRSVLDFLLAEEKGQRAQSEGKQEERKWARSQVWQPFPGDLGSPESFLCNNHGRWALSPPFTKEFEEREGRCLYRVCD